MLTICVTKKQWIIKVSSVKCLKISGDRLPEPIASNCIKKLTPPGGR